MNCNWLRSRNRLYLKQNLFSNGGVVEIQKEIDAISQKLAEAKANDPKKYYQKAIWAPLNCN